MFVAIVYDTIILHLTMYSFIHLISSHPVPDLLVSIQQSGCIGCDGIPMSGKIRDVCGACGNLSNKSRAMEFLHFFYGVIPPQL
jgi:hypothetical protein